MLTGLLTLLLAAAPLQADDPAPSASPVASPPAASPQEASAPAVPLAARAVGLIEGTGAPLAGADAVVTEAQLDDMLLWREARSPGGQRALRQLLEVKVVERLGEVAGLEITEEELRATARDLDDQARAAGLEGGLEEMIRTQGIDRADFDRYLRLSMVHERLARAGLGIAADQEITGDQQQLWLKGELEAREYSEASLPFPEGWVARSGDVTITASELASELRGLMPPADLREACYMILLERAVLARMPELGPAGVEAALEREIGRRRAEAEADPRFHGATYENMLDARGLSLDAVRRDPAVRAAALAHEAVDRATGDAGLRADYEENRLRYDATYGEAVEVYLLWKAAGDDPNNPLVPPARVVSEDLAKIRDAVDGRQEFLRALEIHSEDKRSRENGGLLGRLSRVGRSKDLDALRTACFETIDARPDDYQSVVIGPVRLENGVGLAMLGERRPAPSWDEMAQFVHQELRRKFLESSLAPNQVEILIGAEAPPEGEPTGAAPGTGGAATEGGKSAGTPR
ncbi:MAG: hypothetical protein AAFR54_15555 [Planctomycetota bacterium]